MTLILRQRKAKMSMDHHSEYLDVLTDYYSDWNLWEKEEESLRIYRNDLGRLRKKFKNIERQTQESWSQLIQKGSHKALNNLVQSSLPFVIKIAKKYQNLGLSLNDLISEGNLGLIAAAGKWNWTRGFTFATFAKHHIKSNIITAIRNFEQIVRCPSNRLLEYFKVKKFIESYYLQYGDKPSIELIAKETNIAEDSIFEYVNFKGTKISIDALTHYLKHQDWTDIFIYRKLNTAAWEYP